MHVYLAGEFELDALLDRMGDDLHIPYLLRSFYYARQNVTEFQHKRDHAGQLILDSGAFTFMEQVKDDGTAPSIDWTDYVSEYADFITTHDIDLFFELDIDSVVGHDRVKHLRDQLERETGKSSIPVWHKSRGKDTFLTLCDDYDYVAIGGIVSNEITRSDYKYLRWFIQTAHDHGTRIHGLGFTPTNLDHFPFDSVDSKSWLFGGMTSTVYTFTGTTLTSQTKDRPRKHYLKLRAHNLREWVKYARYMQTQ